jgi:hypothetical protein
MLMYKILFPSIGIKWQRLEYWGNPPNCSPAQLILLSIIWCLVAIQIYGVMRYRQQKWIACLLGAFCEVVIVLQVAHASNGGYWSALAPACKASYWCGVEVRRDPIC